MAYALFGSEMKPNIIGYPNMANAIRPYKNGILTIYTSLMIHPKGIGLFCLKPLMSPCSPFLRVI